MAEFHAGGFSTISEFFGDGVEKEEAAKSKHKEPSQYFSSSGSNRRGVGSGCVPTKINSDDLARRLFRVGKRRRSRNGDDNEDDEDHVEGNENDGEKNEGSDVDEDFGRTEIAVKGKRGETSPKETKIFDLKGKKKAGKEERKRQRLGPGLEQMDDDEKIENPTSNSLDHETTQTTNPQERNQKGKKQRRRKVRSKQKNIRKDTRERKPAHLIPGTANYQGRPLTPETRAKLKMTKKTVPLFVIDRGPHKVSATTASEDVGVGMGLAVDDLLSSSKVDTNASSPPGTGEQTHPKMKRKKIWKGKPCKNLAM